MFEKLKIKEDLSCLGDTDTTSFLLPKSRAISDLLLVVRSQNDSDHNAPDAIAPNTILSSIESIEVRTGNRTFKSYSAEVAMALATYKTGREPYLNLTQLGGTTYPTGWQEAAIPISFSRFPEDPICGLPAPLYTGLEIAIKYDCATTAGMGFETGAAYHKIDLYADLMPHMHTASLANLKIIENLKRQNYTTRASGTDLINMTTSKDKMLRKVFVRAYKTGVEEGTLFSELAMLVNTEEVAEDTWRHWQNRNAEDCDLDFMRVINTKANTAHDLLYSTMPNCEANFQAGTTTSEDVYVVVTGDQVQLAAQTADDLGWLQLRSNVIPATAIIDFDRNLTMSDMLDIDVEKLHLRVLNAGASGAAEVHEEFIAPAVI